MDRQTDRETYRRKSYLDQLSILSETRIYIHVWVLFQLVTNEMTKPLYSPSFLMIVKKELHGRMDGRTKGYTDKYRDIQKTDTSRMTQNLIRNQNIYTCWSLISTCYKWNDKPNISPIIFWWWLKKSYISSVLVNFAQWLQITNSKHRFVKNLKQKKKIIDIASDWHLLNIFRNCQTNKRIKTQWKLI